MYKTYAQGNDIGLIQIKMANITDHPLHFDRENWNLRLKSKPNIHKAIWSWAYR